MTREQSQKYREVEEALPEPLRPIFKQLSEEYKFLSRVHYGETHVAYKVLADLVRAGWRPSAESDPDGPLK